MARQPKMTDAERAAKKRDRDREWRAKFRAENPAKNRESARKSVAKWRVANPTYGAKWRAANADMIAAYNGISGARARGAVIPDGLTARDFEAVYKEARQRTRDSGVQHRVGHVVPLCKGGLHAPQNLAVMSVTEHLEHLRTTRGQ